MIKPRYHLIQKIIILLLALLIPAFCLNFYSLYKANHKLEQQTLLSIHSANTSYIKKLDEDFQQLYHIDYNLQSNYNWIKFSERISSMSVYDKGQYINTLRNQLTLINAISPLLESANIYFPDIGRIYRSSPNIYGSFSQLDSESTAKLNTLFQQRPYLQYYTDPVSKEKTLSLLIPPSSTAVDYRIILTLSIDTLRKSMESNCGVYSEDYYLFLTEDGLTLSNMNTSHLSEVQGQSDSIREESLTQPYLLLSMDDRLYYVFCYQLTYSGSLYIRLIPAAAILNVIPSSYYMIGFFCLLLLLACIIFFFGIYTMVHKPLTRLTGAFKKVEQGDFHIQVEQKGKSDFAYLFYGFNHMVHKLNTLIEENYTQAVLLQKAELQQLQAQINPHFLYNSFFMLQRMILLAPGQAQDIAGALARYFQYITRNSNELITLSAEYNHAKDYIYIQEMRFMGRIRIELEDLPESFAAIPVPRLILQPLLENAFKYGLDNRTENGLLRISFETSNTNLKIIIEDNGTELDEAALEALILKLSTSKEKGYSGEMTGIHNIQKRLVIFTRNNTPLTVFRSSLGGLGVAIILENTAGK